MMKAHPKSCGPRLEQERRWLEKNREAIVAYNARVAEHGLLSEYAGLLTDSVT